jgi:predicted amidohydrolase YtcJ/molybdopterin converting factor small subunit
VKVSFYAGLRGVVGQKSVEVPLPEEATVRDLLDEIIRSWPALRRHLLDENGQLPGNIQVFIDGRSARYLQDGVGTRLCAAAEIDIFPAVGGGRRSRRGAIARGLLPLLLLASILGCEGADLVLRNGTVYTVDAGRRVAEAVAVADGRILFVGRSADAEDLIGPATEVIDLHGRMVLPGLVDSHVHPDLGAFLGTLCPLDTASSKEAILATVEKCGGASVRNGWVLGYGWENEVFFPDVNPKKGELDRRFPNRPTVLISKDMHTFWVNSAALERAGVTADTPDPEGGTIERDPETGEPSGALRDKAVELVLHADVVPGSLESLRLLRSFLRKMSRFGYTSLMDARLSNPEAALGYWILELFGQLDLRVSMALLLDPTGDETQVEQFMELREDYTTDRLKADIVKIFLDGNTDAHLAFLLENYRDADHRGAPYFDRDGLTRTVGRLDREGFSIHVHVIGDGAAHLALDAIEDARKANREGRTRHALTHLELTDREDWPRFAELGVIANISPYWSFGFAAVPGRPTYVDRMRAALGPERSRRNMAFGSLARAGARITAGSDYPFTSLNPFEAIEVGMTRQAPSETSRPPHLPEERLDLETLLAAYTIHGAYQLGLEDRIGSIEVGKAADLIVIDRDLLETPATEISETQVLLTLIEGEEAFRSPAF